MTIPCTTDGGLQHATQTPLKPLPAQMCRINKLCSYVSFKHTTAFTTYQGIAPTVNMPARGRCRCGRTKLGSLKIASAVKVAELGSNS